MKTPIKQQGCTCTATECKQLMCKKKIKEVTKEVKAETVCYIILLKFSIASVTFCSSV